MFQSEQMGTIKMSIGTNNWDVETYRNKLENIILIWTVCSLLMIFGFWVSVLAMAKVTTVTGILRFSW